MIKAISAAQMRTLDREAADSYGIPKLLLMENAGKGMANFILTKHGKYKNILIICGKGNNGGDGFVTAHHLYTHGKTVTVVLFADPAELKGEVKTNYNDIKNKGIPILTILPGDAKNPKKLEAGFLENANVKKSELIVDALFGIGVVDAVAGIYKEVVEWMNRSGKPVVAIDIPSGLDADTGEVHGVAVKAVATATMAFAKHGLLKGKGPELAGEVTVIPIGFPAELLKSIENTV